MTVLCAWPIFDMLSMDVCTTKHWQTSGRLVQELDVCTVCACLVSEFILGSSVMDHVTREDEVTVENHQLFLIRRRVRVIAGP